MRSPSAAVKHLDRNISKLLVYAGAMELQSIELEVVLRKFPLLIAD